MRRRQLCETWQRIDKPVPTPIVVLCNTIEQTGVAVVRMVRMVGVVGVVGVVGGYRSTRGLGLLCQRFARRRGFLVEVFANRTVCYAK